MDEGEGGEVEQDNAEAEEGGLGGGGLMALEATGLLTQDSKPSGTTFVDAYNGFNNLLRLTIL